MVIVEGSVFYVNLLMQMVLTVRVISLSAGGMWAPGVLFCIGRIAALECCSNVFDVLVVLRLLLKSVSFVVLCWS